MHQCIHMRWTTCLLLLLSGVLGSSPLPGCPWALRPPHRHSLDPLLRLLRRRAGLAGRQNAAHVSVPNSSSSSRSDVVGCNGISHLRACAAYAMIHIVT